MNYEFSHQLIYSKLQVDEVQLRRTRLRSSIILILQPLYLGLRTSQAIVSGSNSFCWLLEASLPKYSRTTAACSIFDRYLERKAAPSELLPNLNFALTPRPAS
jgi:hypothetical protein